MIKVESRPVVLVTVTRGLVVSMKGAWEINIEFNNVWYTTYFLLDERKFIDYESLPKSVLVYSINEVKNMYTLPDISSVEEEMFVIYEKALKHQKDEFVWAKKNCEKKDEFDKLLGHEHE
jgi:hypothetical protein